MKILLAAAGALSLSLHAQCKPASGPAGDAEAGALVEAGAAVISGVCSLIEGIDDNGTARNICATLEEVASIAQFILTLRAAPDAGPLVLPATKCAVLPGSTLCATSAERAKAVLFVAKAREKRLLLDGGR